jgi:hypothetical protein
MPRRKETVPLGSISSGTLRTEDLLSAFSDYCRDYGGRDGKKLQREYERMPSGQRWNGHDDPTIDWTNAQQEQAEYLLEEMTECLEGIAPDFAYFGALEGDGAEFGFWPSIDSLEESVRDGEVLKVSDTSEIPAGYRGHVMHVNDHGNVTLYWKSARTLREIWSVV